MTNREKFDVIAEVFATVDREDRDEILEFVEKQKAAIDHKNAIAKKKAAEKRAEGDALRAKVEAIITDEPKTVNDILAELGDETLTPAKVVARTKQLVAEGKVTRDYIKADGRKLTAYVLA